MIALQMVGAIEYLDFASTKREAQQMIESAKRFLRKRGYQIIRESMNEWVGWSSTGDETRILLNPTTPKGVR